MDSLNHPQFIAGFVQLMVKDTVSIDLRKHNELVNSTKDNSDLNNDAKEKSRKRRAEVMRKMNAKRKKLAEKVGNNLQNGNIEEAKYTTDEFAEEEQEMKCQYCHEPLNFETYHENPFGYIAECTNTRVHNYLFIKQKKEEYDEFKEERPDLSQKIDTASQKFQDENFSRCQVFRTCGHMIHFVCKIRQKLSVHGQSQLIASEIHLIDIEQYVCPLCRKHANTIIFPQKEIKKLMIKFLNDKDEEETGVSEVDGISSVYNQCLKKKVEINEILMHVLSSPMRVLYILQNKKEQDSIYANVKYSNIEMLTSQLSK